MFDSVRVVLAYFDKILPRLSGWAIIAIGLLVALALSHPAQLGVVLYKVALVVLAAVLGYWIDRSLFPYARPHTQIDARVASMCNSPKMSSVPALLMLRRAVIVLACILGLTLGL